MTREEKELLLKDLYARILYGFTVYRYSDNRDITFGPNELDELAHFLEYSEGKEFKPYLRPMSSMTEEEKSALQNKFCFGWDYKEEDIWSFFNHHKIYGNDATDLIDWLNEHHFDYHGLIEKGLALEAPSGMYRI